MKRISNLYAKIYDLDNLILADKKARMGKSKHLDIQEHDKNKLTNLLRIQESLINKTYKTSKYSIFTIFEKKERQIYKLPYNPDRILHHAVMNILEPIFVPIFISTTFNCIKKRGIMGAHRAVVKALEDKKGTEYCLKLDIRKFYPNVDNKILKQLLRRKFKDKDLLYLLDEIIDSTIGLPIGNYISQFFANFYLTYFDHWLKEKVKVKYYFRYCDDLVILSSNKEELHGILGNITKYLKDNLNLEVKNNHQIFPVKARGINFVGYVFYHTHILLRKSIKRNSIRMMNYYCNFGSMASYNGWLKYCNSINLRRKYNIQL